MNTKVIMQVLPTLEQGGVETGTIEIAQALQQAKMPNCVVSAGGSMVAQLKKIGVEHITLPVDTKNPFKIFLNALRLKKIIKEKGIALVHVRSRAPAWSVWMACHWAKIPFITTYHGIYGITPAIKKIYNRAMLKGRWIIAGTEFVRQHLIKEYGVDKNKIRLIYRGADLTRFNPDKFSAQDVIDFAQKYQIPTDKPIITLVGRLSALKGQVLLLRALKQIQNKDVTCLLVGGKATKLYERELRKAMAELPGNVTVCTISVSGAQMPLVYLVSDFIVSASLIPETFGRTIVEANAMKRIAIAFNHGGPTETIVDGKTGFLTPVGDVSALAKTIKKVLDLSDQTRKKMQKEAFNNVIDHFSVEQMCKKTLQLYQEMLK